MPQQLCFTAKQSSIKYFRTTNKKLENPDITTHPKADDVLNNSYRYALNF